MNDKLKEYLHENFDGIMFTILCIVIVSVFVCLCPIKYNSNVNGTVQQIKQDVDATGASIKQASLENESARDAVDRASATVGEVRKRTDRVQAGVREANALVAESQRLNQVAQNELKSIAGSNK